MSDETFMGRLRSFFGLQAPQPPLPTEFRNPIWGSDDDDDGDELYSRQSSDVYSEAEMHHMLTKHMQDMFKTFGGMFGDLKFFQQNTIGGFNDFVDREIGQDNHNSNSIRDYYLKPGYNSHGDRKDIDLDGKISSQEISGLLKQKDDGYGPSIITVAPFDGARVPGRPFCHTVITTSVTKSDGTVETRRIIKKGNEIIEETTTSSTIDDRSPHNTGYATVSTPGIIISELASLFKNFY